MALAEGEQPQLQLSWRALADAGLKHEPERSLAGRTIERDVCLDAAGEARAVVALARATLES